MAAEHPFLNSITEINATYLDRLFDDGRTLINQAAADINQISADLPDLNFAGTTPTLIDPTLGSLGTMPTVPIKPVLNEVPIDSFPVAPVLTTDTIATDTLLIDIISQIQSVIEYRISHATGLNEDVENALFDRAIDRESKLTRKAYNRYIASF